MTSWLTLARRRWPRPCRSHRDGTTVRPCSATGNALTILPGRSARAVDRLPLTTPAPHHFGGVALGNLSCTLGSPHQARSRADRGLELLEHHPVFAFP